MKLPRWLLPDPPKEQLPFSQGMTIPPGATARCELDLTEIFPDPELRAAVQRGERKVTFRQFPDAGKGADGRYSCEVQILLDGEDYGTIRMTYQ